MAGVAGQGSASCTNINSLDDFASEGPHSFTVTISDFDLVDGIPGTAMIFLGTPSSASVLIEDNDGTT